MRLLIASVAAAFLLTAAQAAAAPPPLKLHGKPHVSTASSFGSGVFGQWSVDRFGLPSYRYAIDEHSAPEARQPEMNGSVDGWHQVGNDRVVANAYNHGYVQLWSQDRRYQWVNRYQADRNSFAGGYGYMNVDGEVVSTLYDDRPEGAVTEREFGVGYVRRRTQAAGIDAEEFVYAPFGDDPVLLHDVTLTNTSGSAKRVSWFEYWAVNGYRPGPKSSSSVGPPQYDPDRRLLQARIVSTPDDADPLSVYAAALNGPDGGYATNAVPFFGAGGRAAPTAVAADALDSTIPGTPGTSMYAFRAPLELGPGESATLRYAYGAAQAEDIAGIVDRYRAADDPLTASSRRWANWLPRAKLGPGRRWLSRELQWDAYMLRSGATYEECADAHIISQGGYYQYDLGFQGAFRDPLQHMLPLIYAERRLAREVLLYSAQQQPSVLGFIPYAQIDLCRRFDFGSSNDLDLWLLLSAAEYGLASRDFAFFDRDVRYSDGSSAPLWDHLKLAFRHQESQLGPHGGYLIGTTGDWSDFATQFLQMTESTLVSAQTAFVYPRLAELAEARGDHEFAAELRASGARDLETTRREWTGDGWYSRGYAGDRQIGSGAIFGEPQPWAILAGAPSRQEANTLVGHIRRFLTGVDAPAEVNGPARIGSAQSPAANDPEVTERSEPPNTIDGGGAVYVGGVWYAVNGWLTWALADLDGTVPRASRYAFDEFRRNTLAAHADAYPQHWNGVISVDDVCNSHYAKEPPENCGIGLSTGYAGQIMHQPAWSLFDATKLAGIEPTVAGYTIDPHLPARRFSLRLPHAGVAYERRRARGYLRLAKGASVPMRVRPPPGVKAKRAQAWVGDRRVRTRAKGGFVRFRLPAGGDKPTPWAVTRRRR